MYQRNVLFSLHRGDFEEIAVHGEIVVMDGKGVAFQTSEMVGVFPVRSLLKPFQFLATEPDLSIQTDPENLRQTACLGSVSATSDQVESLKSWYGDTEKHKLAGFLKLPPSYPMDEKNRVKAKEAGIGPQVFFHTCFSKHMGILTACKKNGWDLNSYCSEEHPYQKKLIKLLEKILAKPLKNLHCVPDGCLLPSPVLSLKQMGRLYQKLAEGRMTTELAEARALMIENPQWIGGPKRIDTLLMEVNKGKLIAKEGADGLLGIGIVPTKEWPEGLGIIVKLSMGYHPGFAALAVAPMLEALGLHPVHEAPKGHEVHFHYRPFGKNRMDLIDISPRIGNGTVVWPGDVPFQKESAYETAKGDHMTLSAIRTTVHVGAHTDAPKHFEKCNTGIDEVSLEKYAGPAQVISVTKSQNTTIQVKDIEQVSIRAKRVLFHTDSFPNPSEFNKDFVAVSPEVIRYLAGKGVVLVGIDTPSIDLFDSKDLPAHHETTKHGMGILEGICFDSVDDGIYELMALPLKLEGLDASPVRAVLRVV